MPPNPANAGSRLKDGTSIVSLEKRSREDDEGTHDGARVQKRERPSGDDDGEEMELEDEDDSGNAQQPGALYCILFHEALDNDSNVPILVI